MCFHVPSDFIENLFWGNPPETINLQMMLKSDNLCIRMCDPSLHKVISPLKLILSCPVQLHPSSGAVLSWTCDSAYLNYSTRRRTEMLGSLSECGSIFSSNPPGEKQSHCIKRQHTGETNLLPGSDCSQTNRCTQDKGTLQIPTYAHLHPVRNK